MEGLGGLLHDPVLTLERIRVCKRDGVLLAEPRHLPEQDDAGLGIWQKLMVYAGEQARHDGHPLYIQLIRRLREENASGATALRGIWGFSGDHAAARRPSPLGATARARRHDDRRHAGARSGAGSRSSTS